MGADVFTDRVSKKAHPKVHLAFMAACEQAAWDYGHSGYTGTIAEKGSFVFFDLPEGVTVADALTALDKSYSVWEHTETGMVERPAMKPEWAARMPMWNRMVKLWNDKWEAAVALDDGDDWVFTGWASC